MYNIFIGGEYITDKEILEAIRSILESEREHTSRMMDEKLAPIKEDIAEIKDEAKITRYTANLLLKWAEKSDRTAVNVGLYDEK